MSSRSAFTFTRALEDAGTVRQVVLIVAPDIQRARACLHQHLAEIRERSGRSMPEYEAQPPFHEYALSVDDARATLVLSSFTHG